MDMRINGSTHARAGLNFSQSEMNSNPRARGKELAEKILILYCIMNIRQKISALKINVA